MKYFAFVASIFIGSIVLPATAVSQIDDICRTFGHRPSSDEPRGRVPYLYGRIILRGYNPATKYPRVTVNFLDFQQSQGQLTLEPSGNYCFRRTAGGGGTLIVEVDGVEAARKTVSSIGPPQQREDFEVYPPAMVKEPSPGVISAKFVRPPNEKTVELYRKAAEAEENKQFETAVRLVEEIISIDRMDFVARAKLGSLYVSKNQLKEAERAFRDALEIRGDYTPALLNLGMLAAVQNYYPAAIFFFQEAIKSEPTSARAHRLLGEAYLQNKQGSLGLAALDEALRLDPDGMAECHLLKARLYDLAGAKKLASSEYRRYLKKVPADPDKKTFEKYIRDNPE